MRKLMFGFALFAVLALSGSRANASGVGYRGPWTQTVTFSNANPPGWYSNTYSFAWQYPWFAYYNYSHGPYAYWAAGGGFATYSTYPGGHPVYHGVILPPPPPPRPPVEPKKDPADPKKELPNPAKVQVSLPPDATLLFNGVSAKGTGAVRTFSTPTLQPGQDYGYDLTAEVMRNGRMERHTERVVVRAGETTQVTLSPGAAVSAR